MTVERRYIAYPRHPRLSAANLEPALFVLNVSSDKLFVRLRQVNDPFDDADNTRSSARYNADTQLNNSLGGVAEDELVYSECAEQNRTNTRDNLLVGSHRFPISHRAGINSLHRLIAGVDGSERRLASVAELRRLIVDGAAFCTVSGHRRSESPNPLLTKLKLSRYFS